MSKPVPYGGPYAQMEFPEYRYRDYPKMLVGKDGKPLINPADGKEWVVNSATEELRAMSEVEVGLTPVKAESEIKSLQNEKAALESQLEKLQRELAQMAQAAAPAQDTPPPEDPPIINPSPVDPPKGK